jgi:hypothetical protein
LPYPDTSLGAATTHYYAVRLCTKFGVLGTGAGDSSRPLPTTTQTKKEV